jgi:hypothetical protein
MSHSARRNNSIFSFTIKKVIKTQFEYRPNFIQFEVLFFEDKYTATIDIINNMESMNPHQIGD